ncbi:hypothetical protein CPB84DRAFT_958552 [Gymnopilus junonius]|uniref:Uncharacterized protein n=1 Tax=Gymnopilus junonius TaxID=109634 RepID=A0A9P5TPA4_GYMJU|nr:hypothetical protein CPB84DRAFT_958552 [Gymnopilus junonius]
MYLVTQENAGDSVQRSEIREFYIGIAVTFTSAIPNSIHPHGNLELDVEGHCEEIQSQILKKPRHFN